MKKYYDNARDNVAFERCVDVMAGLMLKYGCQVLERHKNAAYDNEPQEEILQKAA
ncbi:MAG: hypothetical protein LUF78_10440 [Clostridiales bacterium]|nr:hypothetical protein [Clostridiales bacterium]